MVSMTRTREDIAWAAGLFEGEGCFYTQQNHRRHRIVTNRDLRAFCAGMVMTDEDTVRRFATIMGFGHCRTTRPKNPTHKQLYEWRTGSFEGFQATVAMLWPWLCQRRRARAKELMLMSRAYFERRRAYVKPHSPYRRVSALASVA